VKRMLIAEVNEPLMDAIEKIFSAQFEIRTCRDGDTALALILDFQPEILVLNLSLPYKDGLTVLQEAAYMPPMILVNTNYTSPYIEKRCLSLSVGYLMLSPTVNALRVRILDMVSQYESNAAPSDLRTQTEMHLHILQFATHTTTAPRLVDAILLFHEDRDQCLKESLYPRVAAIHGCSDTTAERSLGRLIKSAWSHRDPVIWEGYGLNTREAPSNKFFLDAIDKKLK